MFLKQQLIKEQALLLAVSWGPDSMALLSFVKEFRINQSRDPSSLHIVTCDHNTRPNTKLEAQLVHEESKPHQFTSVVYDWSSFDEASMRNWRHKKLVEYCNTHAITTLMTGHHLDDRIETSLLNMKRWSGLEGIRSMLPEQSHFLAPSIRVLRPLLTRTKENIISYCNTNDISYMIDPSNTDPYYSERNAIRSILKQHFVSPQWYQSFLRLYKHLDSLSSSFKKNDTITILPTSNYDIVPLPAGQWTAELLYKLYQEYHISINPRSGTLPRLAQQLDKPGNKISYQWLTIQAYSYASIIIKHDQPNL